MYMYMLAYKDFTVAPIVRSNGPRNNSRRKSFHELRNPIPPKNMKQNSDPNMPTVMNRMPTTSFAIHLLHLKIIRTAIGVTSIPNNFPRA